MPMSQMDNAIKKKNVYKQEVNLFFPVEQFINYMNRVSELIRTFMDQIYIQYINFPKD